MNPAASPGLPRLASRATTGVPADAHAHARARPRSLRSQEDGSEGALPPLPGGGADLRITDVLREAALLQREAPELFARFQDEALGNGVGWEKFRRFPGFRLQDDGMGEKDREAVEKAETTKKRLELVKTLFRKLDSDGTGLARNPHTRSTWTAHGQQ